MATVVAFANQKGGVGKTTSAIHIAAAFAALRYKVLLCDLDPQGNVASGLGVNKSELRQDLYRAMVGECTASDAILPSYLPNLSLLPSGIRLAGAESELSGVEGGNSRISSLLTPILPQFDYIFLDCPPSISLLTVNALTAASRVVVPMTMDFYALEGLSQLSFSIRRVRELYKSDLSLTAILPTMYDARLTLSHQVLQEIRQHYGEKLLNTPIPRSVRLAEAPGFGKTVFETAPRSNAALAYRAAARELSFRI